MRVKEIVLIVLILNLLIVGKLALDTTIEQINKIKVRSSLSIGDTGI